MWLNDILRFFFPVFCPVCEMRTAIPGGVLCLECEHRIPRTGYRDNPHNPVSMTFWGRVPITLATSLFRFEKGSAYQRLLHELKYRGNRKTGLFLGSLLGKALQQSAFMACEMLVPVPLHPKRLRERGYNQSELIAQGMAEIMGVPVETSLLERCRWQSSQTRLGRFDRFENVSEEFRITSGAPDVSGKCVLLVDDVLTTGATLEACGQAILDQYSCAVYAATVCCA